jgi:voltage-gated potassium channel Kch
MLPMSLKSVPGCLTLIEPTGIGVPVAATPGFVPQLEVLLDALPEALVAVVAVVDDEPEAAAALLAVVLLLLPQAARASNASTAASAMPHRARQEP